MVLFNILFLQMFNPFVMANTLLCNGIFEF